MWISKKKWLDLEKRMADLEEKVQKVQSQPATKVNIEPLTHQIQESLRKQISKLRD